MVQIDFTNVKHYFNRVLNYLAGYFTFLQYCAAPVFTVNAHAIAFRINMLKKSRLYI